MDQEGRSVLQVIQPVADPTFSVLHSLTPIGASERCASLFQNAPLTGLADGWVSSCCCLPYHRGVTGPFSESARFRNSPPPLPSALCTAAVGNDVREDGTAPLSLLLLSPSQRNGHQLRISRAVCCRCCTCHRLFSITWKYIKVVKTSKRTPHLQEAR